MNELTERVVAAYQFAAQSLGDRVPIADIRLHLRNVGPETLNPHLRALNDCVVDFYSSAGSLPLFGMFSLEQSVTEPTWRELDDGVEIAEVIYTHLVIKPH